MIDLHRPAGTCGHEGDPVLITPEVAGWGYAGLRVLALRPGEHRTIATGDYEMAILPLAGACTVEVNGEEFDLQGRGDVFTRVSDFAYAPVEAEVRITSPGGGEFALPMAKASRRLDPAYGPAAEIPVEVRGAGQATRQVTNFLNPDSFDADKLIAVEVLTPAGNWSSYPPHKHDEFSDCEVALEEIYYFRIPGRAGFGVHKTYAADGEFDETVTVADGDVFLIPKGYHGPTIAAPGYDMYYLNVMAGPGAERVWKFCDDPAHGWIRDTWAALEPDPRCPMTTAAGPSSP